MHLATHHHCPAIWGGLLQSLYVDTIYGHIASSACFLMYLLTPNGATQLNDVHLGKVYLGSLFVRSSVRYVFLRVSCRPSEDWRSIYAWGSYKLGACRWHHGINGIHMAKSVLTLCFFFIFFFLSWLFVSGCVEYSFYSWGDQVKIGALTFVVGFVQTWATWNGTMESMIVFAWAKATSICSSL